jgi:CRISPR-associated protein Csd2
MSNDNSAYENAISKRYEFVLLYDVENGNPNGDPDAGNMPRLDPESGHGIVTDVCIKRKIRNYIDLVKDGEEGFDIYVKQGVLLSDNDKRGISEVKSEPDLDKRSEGFRDFMCRKFFDIRTFGAVMVSAGKKGADVALKNTAGQVRGPVQLAFGRSVDPIVPQEITITRVAITNEKAKTNSETEMGRKNIVPYGLYRQEGFISANLARKVTGFSNADLEQFWNAVIHMFDEDRSAARGKMTLRELIVFEHSDALGNAPAHKLFELISVARKEGVTAPRSYDDYVVSIAGDKLPDGVTLTRKV